MGFMGIKIKIINLFILLILLLKAQGFSQTLKFQIKHILMA